MRLKLQSKSNIWQLCIKCRMQITKFLILLAKWVLPEYEKVIKEQERLEADTQTTTSN
jgi:hypothetical protein